MPGGAAPGRPALLAAALLAAAGPAAADPVNAARAALFDGQRSWLGYTEAGENTNAWKAVNVYDLSRRPSSMRFVARRDMGAGARSSGVSWADSRTCPALVERLETLPQVSARFLAPAGLERWPSAPVAVDGTDYTIWGAGFTAASASYARLEVTENLGPVADWGEATDAALEPCWSAVPPDPAH